jgi:hypothetical protein
MKHEWKEPAGGQNDQAALVQVELVEISIAPVITAFMGAPPVPGRRRVHLAFRRLALAETVVPSSASRRGA